MLEKHYFCGDNVFSIKFLFVQDPLLLLFKCCTLKNIVTHKNFVPMRKINYASFKIMQSLKMKAT